MREKGFDSINVVPFIDIMLVLVTIVLATATFMKTGIIPVELPVVPQEEISLDDESVYIDISPDGLFLFLSQVVELEALPGLLEEISRDITITVRADKNAQIQSFASLMNLLKDCGFKSVNLQTERAGE